ncbi:MAG TPA: TetR/AcrR family transcriptional regulator [Solirubrobacteraceae bacterium]|jgi:AcrR family transcriptional regulator|nr:TetR/AcrR family transcriptional regulator [Solirubrobacteraceae bacterium]
MAPPEPTDDLELPPSIELLWGLREAGSRGPRRGLTLAGIVDAGIRVAQTEGVGALSMARIARELGVGTMSLYRYVASKDELLTAMVDTALGPPPPPPAGEDWRAGLTRWAVGVRIAYHSQPWSLRVPISGPPLGPNNVAWLDNALAALAGTPLAEQEKLSCVLLVSGFVRNDVTLALDFAEASAGTPQMPGYGRLLARLTTAEELPSLHRAIASGSLDDPDDPDVEFNFGLARILEGIAGLMASKGTRPPSRRAR